MERILYAKILICSILMSVVILILGFDAKAYEYLQITFNDNKIEQCEPSQQVLDSVKQNNDYLRKAIWSDIDSAFCVWQNIMPDKNLLINMYNLPDKIKEDFFNGKKYSYLYLDDTKDYKLYGKKINKLLHKGINVMNVNYAIQQDSLLIYITENRYIIEKKELKKENIESFTFIHEYDCENCDWKLLSVASHADKILNKFNDDLIRVSLYNAIKDYVNKYNLYWQYSLDRYGEFTVGDKPHGIAYIYDADIPVDMNIFKNDEVKTIDYLLKDTSSYKKIFSSPQWLLRVSFLLYKNDFVIKITSYQCSYSNGSCRMCTYGFGLYSYKYDCNTNQWEKSNEQIYVI